MKSHANVVFPAPFKMPTSPIPVGLALQQKAEKKYASKDYRGALADIESTLEQNPNNSTALLLRDNIRYFLAIKTGVIPAYNPRHEGFARTGIPPELWDFDRIEKEFIKKSFKDAPGVHLSHYSLTAGNLISFGVHWLKFSLTSTDVYISLFLPLDQLDKRDSWDTWHLHVPESDNLYERFFVVREKGPVHYYKNGKQKIKKADRGDIVFHENTVFKYHEENDRFSPVKSVYNFCCNASGEKERDIADAREYLKKNKTVILCQIGDSRTIIVRSENQIYSMRRKIDSRLYGAPLSEGENLQILTSILPFDRRAAACTITPTGRNIFVLSYNLDGNPTGIYVGMFNKGLPHGPGIIYTDTYQMKESSFLIWNQGSIIFSAPLIKEDIENCLGIEKCLYFSSRQRGKLLQVASYQAAFDTIDEAQLSRFQNYADFKMWCEQQVEIRAYRERQLREEQKREEAARQREAQLRAAEYAAALNRAAVLLPNAVQEGLKVIPFRALTLERVLGRGGFGVVRKAKWQGTDVAVKQLLAGALSESALEEFRREAAHHAKLKHPNIVILHGVCLEPQQYCLVMEYMPVGSLFAVLHDKIEQFPWPVRLIIINAIVEGLQYLHNINMIHCDLKSHNILLNHDMQAKLADFGLSKVRENVAATTTVGGAAGTLYWMAPELFEIDSHCTKEADIYALGMVLWEIASRDLPYRQAKGNEHLVIKWVGEGKRPDIPQSQEIPKGMGALIGKCWAQRAESRPPIKEVIKEAVLLRP